MNKIIILLALLWLVVSTNAYSQLNRKNVQAFKNLPKDTLVKIAEKVGQNLGKWSPVYDWPVAAIHMSVLPNGKVLVWDDTSDDGIGIYNSPGPFHTSVWDPLTNIHNTVPILQRNPSNIDMFCAAHAQLPNGDIMTGTGPGALTGFSTDHGQYSQVYNWRIDQWYRIANTNYTRYYPSLTALANGNIMLLGGNYAADFTPLLNTDLDKAELYANGRWTVLDNTQMNFASTYRGFYNNTSYFPWIQQAPNGQVFYAGPEMQMRYIDPVKKGAVANMGNRDNFFRDYGSYAMYDIGKILVAGGGNSPSETFKIDINGGVPITTSAGSMNYGRRQNNLTILADGTVLVTGGNSSVLGTQFDLATSTNAAEIWNPTTNNWVTLSSMKKGRQYHSTAVLVPDGRVILGGGICTACELFGQNNINAEYFSPPYLFKPDGTDAPRPSIIANPQFLTYDSTFNITVNLPVATTIKNVHLIKLSSVTHSTNFDQRLVPLTFSGTAQSLSVRAPASGNIATPGFYMLIVVNSEGAPSVAKIVQLGNGGDYVIPEPRPDGSPNSAAIVKENGTAVISWAFPLNERISHFEIEKFESDGSFKTIHIENVSHVAKDELSHYQFRDLETIEGINSYRIKVVSDKAPTYFEKLSVKFDSDNDFIISPNPTKTYIDVNLSSIKGKKVVISLFDLGGQVKYKDQIEANSFSNRIELKDLEAGQYFMRIETDDRKPVVKRFTIVK